MCVNDVANFSQRPVVMGLDIEEICSSNKEVLVERIFKSSSAITIIRGNWLSLCGYSSGCFMLATIQLGKGGGRTTCSRCDPGWDSLGQLRLHEPELTGSLDLGVSRWV